MTMTPVQLWDAAITLENDRKFYEDYTSGAKNEKPVDRRWRIGAHVTRLNLAHGGVEYSRTCNGDDKEHLRRYFDSQYDMDPCPGPNTRAYLDVIEFWKDEVRFPDKYAMTQVERDLRAGTAELLATAASIIDDVDKLCGIPEQHYTHPNAPGMLYRKGADGFVEYRPALGGTWADCAHMTNNRLNEASGYVLASYTLQANAPMGTNGTNMNAITITTKTLVNGNDVATMTDSQVYDLIAQQEAEIAKLEAIKSKPARLVAELAKRQAGIDALVAHLDSKDKIATTDAA